MGQHQFDSIEDQERLDFIKNELWIKEKYVTWQKEKEEAMKKQLAENSRYKQYRRYIRNHGVGRMTFDDS